MIFPGTIRNEPSFAHGYLFTFWWNFGQIVDQIFGQVFDQIFGQVFDQVFGQGFDQVLGEGKNHKYSVQYYWDGKNTVYSTTRTEKPTTPSYF